MCIISSLLKNTILSVSTPYDSQGLDTINLLEHHCAHEQRLKEMNRIFLTGCAGDNQFVIGLRSSPGNRFRKYCQPYF